VDDAASAHTTDVRLTGEKLRANRQRPGSNAFYATRNDSSKPGKAALEVTVSGTSHGR
jgi:hypothetical protein